MSEIVTSYRSTAYIYELFQKAAAHVYAPHMAAGRGLVSGFTFNFDTETHGTISHVDHIFHFSNQCTDLELSLQVALHTAYVKELDLLPYLALTTTTGAVQLWQGDIVQWTREEGLSRLQVAEMAELPERKTIASHDIGQDETFINRARRQLADAKVRI